MANDDDEMNPPPLEYHRADRKNLIADFESMIRMKIGDQGEIPRAGVCRVGT